MSNRVRFLVTRTWDDTLTQALVEADVIGMDTTSSEELLKRIRRAVTSWVKETEEGRHEWKLSSEDFNVGDLSTCYNDVELQARFRREGIVSLSIETNVHDACRAWQYDTVLVDEDELEK